jgi:L-fuconolactonase
MLLIDNHVHAGDKYGPVEDIIKNMDDHGVTHAVIVQHMGQYNNSYLVECLDRYPDRLWAACMVDLSLPDAPKTLKNWLKQEGLHGVRLPAMTLSRRPDVWEAAAANHGVISVAGLHGRDMGQIHRLKEFLEDFPRARLKLEHMAHPDPTMPPPYITYSRVMELAEYKNVYLQLTPPYAHSKQPYPYDDMKPFLDMARKHFGPYRLLWGSAFPSSERFIGYDQTIKWLDTLELSDFQREQIVSLNALRLWDPRKKKVAIESGDAESE